jgi:hypothetical protein
VSQPPRRLLKGYAGSRDDEAVDLTLGESLETDASHVVGASKVGKRIGQLRGYVRISIAERCDYQGSYATRCTPEVAQK